MAPKKKDEAPARKYKGVYRNCGAWRARIWDNDHEVYLGHFTEAQQADYVNDLSALMDKTLDAVVAELRVKSIATKPVDADRLLK